MRTLVVFLVLLLSLKASAADISETACPAKCGQSEEEKLVSATASALIHDEYLASENDLLNWKDEWLNEADRWLLDETLLNEDIQADILEGRDRAHNLIDEVNSEKVVSDSKNIFTELDTWFNTIDLTEARADADAEIGNFQSYITDYKQLKDDFVQNSLYGLFEDFVSLGGEYAEENFGGANPEGNESIKPTLDGQKKSSRGKRAKARLESTIAAFRNQYDDIVAEKRDYYQGLEDKYQTEIDDFKAKKASWREWIRTWRHREGEDSAPGTGQ